MDESAFDIDQINLAAMVRKFPPRRHQRSDRDGQHHDGQHHDAWDVGLLETTPRADHARHAWDEGGHH
jgi:hypothetical protein